MDEDKKIKLVLEDGTEFSGKSFGDHRSVAGEVVFNTAMAGYPESLTDPSYQGQILVSTYPLVGNYGVPPEVLQDGIPAFYESDRIHISGFVISDYSMQYSHWNAKGSLSQWLKEQKVPGIYGIDTRELTKILREKGAMLGKMEVEGEPVDFYDPNLENLVAQVSVKEKITYGSGKYKITLVDTGGKYNIIRSLIKRDAAVTVVPWDYDFTGDDYDGLMLANGPGDPKMCGATIRNIQKAITQERPIFGICLGNQLLGTAAGGSTHKLKYGHRAHNHPVLKIGTHSCYITSQNHGYVLDTNSLNNDWEPLFVNINDQTNEGIRHKTRPFFSTQFHPEASSGPTDTEFLFDDFMALIKESKVA